MPVVSEKGSSQFHSKQATQKQHVPLSLTFHWQNPSVTVTSSCKGGWEMKSLTIWRLKGGGGGFSSKREKETRVGRLCHRSHPLSQWSLWFYCQIPKASSHSSVRLPLGVGGAVGLSIQAANLFSPSSPWFYFVLCIGFPHRFPLKKEWAKIFL